MQTQPAGARFPVGAGGMLGEPLVHIPGHAAVSGLPRGWQDQSHVDHSWLIRSSRHNGPDILETLVAALRKCDTLFRLVPCPRSRHCSAQMSQKIAVIRREKAGALSLIQHRRVNAVSTQGWGLARPVSRSGEES